MNFYKSESLEKPVAQDFTSSPTTVFLRKNIEQVSVKDPETGESKLVWQYDEARISKTEYISILNTKQEETDEALQEVILMLFEEG